ncbi:bifunctional 2-C-methyl-D-erythritol 4-phosphate cytidylyltransferase/2-C-methyl-D-erythritol 2,4-cyclodiphosphate synthase [Actibacterium lipolyticum]|nr:bifunctional 2-C-methyl-D-erythritol 4-phosphate cytidylyltransferase/2-C-methyl-D-erythritol 2,4-cyclodiphosphate synthase [Actibacterium lipolyticum]
MQTAAIIVAAGRGVRAGGDIPKQFQLLIGKPVLAHTLEKFASHPGVGQIILVLSPQDDAVFSATMGDWADKLTIVAGGETRVSSVQAGLAAANEGTDAVLIHDGARPLVQHNLIDRVLAELETHPGAAPAMPVTDALWRGDGGKVSAIQSRTGLFRAQTPQGFHLDAIREANATAPQDAKDDVEIAIGAGLDVAIVEGDETNIKITHPGDFLRAARILQESVMDIRTGNGFDVHRFGDGDAVTLCGVTIPYPRGLQGHSDADVGMHAVTDAIYGALAMGDIGQHFPPSDPQWKGAASHIFLTHAAELAKENGFTLTHADVTLICEQPKIGPHAQAMRVEMARIMGIDIDRVSVKATTSERLGFTGREEGIAASATATLVKA